MRRHGPIWLACSAAILFGITSAPAARATCFSHTTAADFAPGSGCHVGDRDGGEVLLAPTAGSEFDGNALPAGWGTMDWTANDGPADGTAVVAAGSLTLDGIGAWDPTDYGAGRAVEFVATFGAAPFQHIGFGVFSGGAVYNSAPFAMFSTGNTSSELRARIDTGSGESFQTLTCAGGCLGVPHHFRIEWRTMPTPLVRFFVDDMTTPVFTSTALLNTALRVSPSDLNAGGATLQLAWLRITLYAAPCAYESLPIDSGAAESEWTSLAEGALLPLGTGLTIETRTGDNPTIDGTWSAYQAVSGGTIASPRARYLQYRANLATIDADQTPELEDVQVCFTPCTPTAEICDGQDNDCDGNADEGDPGGGFACATGQLGVCAAGTTQCSGGAIVCNQDTPASAEICDGLDNDCDGAPDEGDPGGGIACSTGQQGVCAAGTTQCSGGAVVCTQNTAAGPEVCDGLDNDCDGSADDGNPGGGFACATGFLGVCAAGTTQCSGGAIACNQNVAPSAEVCDGFDNNCNGTPDEGNPGGGLACSTGQPGVCAAGTTQCSGGAIACNQNTSASAELCDGLDNDCDGSTDESNPGGGVDCSTGQPGVCAAGTTHCSGGAIACNQNVTGAPEACDGLDNDCDGQTDEGDPGGGGACVTGNPGICAAGTNHCQSGAIVCMQNNTANAEMCNNLDDDCDGSTDEGNPGGGTSCTTPLPGVCGPGTTQCNAGAIVCQSNLNATPETCNGLDDNCNSQVDESNPGGGAACATGQPGVCAAGTTQCQSPTLVCVANVAPSTEICGNGIDESCNSLTDEAPCMLCAPANTVVDGAQTKTSVIKLSTTTGRDKLIAKGTFVLPSSGLIDPPNQAVTIRLTDNVGTYYEATLPSGEISASSSGLTFQFKDSTAPYEHAGLYGAKLKISGGGERTTRYLFKARDMNLPPFVPGTGTVTVRVGSRCFQDNADLCTLTPSGSKAKCK